MFDSLLTHPTMVKDITERPITEICTKDSLFNKTNCLHEDTLKKEDTKGAAGLTRGIKATISSLPTLK